MDPPCVRAFFIGRGGVQKAAGTCKKDAPNGEGENVKEGFRDPKERDKRQNTIGIPRPSLDKADQPWFVNYTNPNPEKAYLT